MAVRMRPSVRLRAESVYPDSRAASGSSQALSCGGPLCGCSVSSYRRSFNLYKWVVSLAFSLTIFCTMTQCRDLENRYHEKLLEISITTLEKSVKNELDEDLPADVRMVRAPKKFISARESARRGGHSLFSEETGFPGGSIQLKPWLNQSITSS